MMAYLRHHQVVRCKETKIRNAGLTSEKRRSHGEGRQQNVKEKLEDFGPVFEDSEL